MNGFRRIALTGVLAVAVGCTGDTAPSTFIGVSSTAAAPTTVAVDRPTLTSVDVSEDGETYSLVEMTVELDAEYDNPFDQREVSLDATFTGPGGDTMTLPGFWDGDGAWKLRFTPAADGVWGYSIVVTTVAAPAHRRGVKSSSIPPIIPGSSASGDRSIPTTARATSPMKTELLGMGEAMPTST